MENITYEEFIQNILETRGRCGCSNEYYEKHHVLPKCIGGTDEEENLIDLFAKEHFIAHKLLALENPKNEKLQYAWWCMCSCKEYNGKRIYDVSPEDYEEARIRCVNLQKNRVISEDEKKKQKELALKGEDHPWYGKHHTEETKQKIRESRKGKYSGENHALYGRHHSEETKKKMRENHADVSGENNPMYGADRSGTKGAFYGKCHTEETKNKISESRKGKCVGENNPNYGKPRSEETKRKLSENNKGKYAGEKHPRATIIIQLDMSDNLIKVWRYAKLAAKELKIGAGSISSCANGKLKSAGGYHWKFLYDNKLNDKIIPGAISLGLITEEDALKLLQHNKMIADRNNNV